MFIHSTRQWAGRALTALSLGISLGLGVLSMSCSKNDSAYTNPAPAISAFYAAKTNDFANSPGSTVSIGVGGSAWFRANFGAKGGSAVVTPGDIPVTSNVPFQITGIATTTTYTLTLTSGDGKKAAATATVTVLVAPSALTYTNEDATYYAAVQIAANAVATVAGATPMTYAVSPLLPSGLSLDAATGSITGTPGAITPLATYTVTATNAVGSTTRDINITVADTPLTFSAAPINIPPGGTTILSWDANSVPGVFSGVTITASPADTTLPATFALTATANVSPAVTTSYTMSATPAAGGSAVSKSVDVTVGAAPVHFTSFTATPSWVVYGNTSTLGWSYTGEALNLTLDGASVLGSLSQLVTPTGRQTYSLAGSNALGSDTATVTVGARALYHVAGSISSGRGNVDGGLDSNGFSMARFYRPNSISWDEKANDGTMIVCDYSGNLVRRITPDRVVHTIAGTPGVVGIAADNTDTSKVFNPRNCAVDPVTGDIYVGGESYTTKRLLKLAPKGDGTYTPSVVPGFTMNTNALVIDSTRMMYFVEYPTGKLYKMDLTGAPSASLLVDLSSTIAANTATAMARDFNGNRKLLYVVGTNKIFKIDLAQTPPVATLIAGTGAATFIDSLSATSGTLNTPQGIAVDTTGNVYIADRFNFAIRMIPVGGPLPSALITIAGKTGTATEGYASSAITLDGTTTLPTSTTACLSNVYYVAVQGDGTAGTKLYVADAGAGFDNQAIRVMTVSSPSAGSLTYTLDDPTKPAGYAYAGSPRVTGNADGLGVNAKFNFGTLSGANLATLPDGSLTFAADTGNNAARVITANGAVTTLKNATSIPFTFTAPKSVALQVDPATKVLVALFVGDAPATKKIRRFTPNLTHNPDGTFTMDGTFTEDVAFTITGGTFPASVDAQGLAVDSTGAGTLYVTDATLGQVFKVALPSGNSSDFVAATGTKPVGVALQNDASGKFLWVSVFGGNQVKKYDMTGNLTLTVGSGAAGYADGTAATATFFAPMGIAVDGNGFVYVNNFATATASQTQNGIRAINDATGDVTTLFGYATSTTVLNFFGTRPGLLLPDLSGTTAAKSIANGVINTPQGLTVNQTGDLLVSTSQSIYKVVAPAKK
jgi:hypothetical protein